MNPKPFIFSLLICFVIGQSTFAQQVFSDKKDPFTNIRTIHSTLSPLYRVAFTPLLQVQTSISLKNDSLNELALIFIVPEVPVEIDIVDSTIKDVCLLKDGNGKIYTGIVSSSVSAAGYRGYNCIFLNDEIYNLSKSTITDIKITTKSGRGGVFQVDKKLQDNIAKQIIALLKRSKITYK